MVDLLLAGDRRRLRTKGVVLSVYDPCYGSGGMLTIAKEHVAAGETRGGEPWAPAVNPGADIHLFGQEVNPETFAICKSDLFMKSEDGRDAENVVFGSTLSNDRHAGAGFDYMIANPPYARTGSATRTRCATSTTGARPAASARAPSAAGSRSSGSRTSCGCSSTSRTSATRKVDRDGEERDAVISRVYPTTHFGFRKITVERPLRLDFQASPERIARHDDERAFANLAVPRKRGEAGARDEEAGRKQQAAIRAVCSATCPTSSSSIGRPSTTSFPAPPETRS